MGQAGGQAWHRGRHVVEVGKAGHPGSGHRDTARPSAYIMPSLTSVPWFCPQQTGPISATLVMTRPIKGPRDIQLDLEMITVNTVINFRGSSVIRLRIYVSQYPF